MLGIVTYITEGEVFFSHFDRREKSACVDRRNRACLDIRMRSPRLYYVYIMASNNRNCIYVGMTNNLIRRILEHRESKPHGFTGWYHCVNLVYYDYAYSPMDAIRAEKRIKKWRREKKNKLISSMNPEWKDLGVEVLAT